MGLKRNEPLSGLMKHRGLGPTPRLPESGGLRAENLHFEQAFRCHCCCCCWSENHLPRLILHLAGGTPWPREVGEVPKLCLILSWDQKSPGLCPQSCTVGCVNMEGRGAKRCLYPWRDAVQCWGL